MDDDDKPKGHAWTWFAWLGSVVVFGSLWTVLFRRPEKSVSSSNVALPLTFVPPGDDEPRARLDLSATGPILEHLSDKTTHPEVAALLQGSSAIAATSTNGAASPAKRAQTVADAYAESFTAERPAIDSASDLTTVASMPIVAETVAPAPIVAETVVPTPIVAETVEHTTTEVPLEAPSEILPESPAEPFQWVAMAPHRLVVVPAKRSTNWVQFIAAFAVVAVILAGTAEAFLRFKAENVAVPDQRPNLTVRVSAIKRLEGDYLAEEAVDDTGTAPAVNAQITTLIFSSAAEAENFERRAQSESSATSPVMLGVFVAGEHRMVYESPVAAHREQLVFAGKMERDLAVTVAGHVNYQDPQGRFYQTYFCFTRSAHTKFRDCAAADTRNRTAPQPSRHSYGALST
jgi:hypothetical protein